MRQHSALTKSVEDKCTELIEATAPELRPAVRVRLEITKLVAGGVELQGASPEDAWSVAHELLRLTALVGPFVTAQVLRSTVETFEKAAKR